MNETSIKLSVLKMLRQEFRPAWWYKTHDLFTSGIPDILGCFKGIFIAIELKVPGKDATPLQRFVLNAIASAGGVTGVAHSVDEARRIVQEGVIKHVNG